MTYIIDRLPGSDCIADSQQISQDILDRYQACKIVFSYAREDWPFVEQAGKALRTYFPQRAAFCIDNGPSKRNLENVFCYTTGSRQFQWVEPREGEGEQCYLRRNEEAADRCYKQLLQTANAFVMFTYKGMVKKGNTNVAGMGMWQPGELLSWNHLNDPRGHRWQYMVDFERAYEARHRDVTVLEQLPAVDPLRDDPRFQDIVRRMNFPEN